MNVDAICLGEPLLRLSPPLRGQIRRAAQFDARVVGSQLNVAADLARLDRRAAFVTKLPEGPLGQLALDTIRSYGVDTSAVRLVPGSRLLLRDVCVNPTRTGFVEILRRMGAMVEERARAERCGEPWADLEVRGSRLRGTSIGADEVGGW